jgi:hypothetical protein
MPQSRSMIWQLRSVSDLPLFSFETLPSTWRVLQVNWKLSLPCWQLELMSMIWWDRKRSALTSSSVREKLPHYACSRGDTEIVTVLLAAGAQLETQAEVAMMRWCDFFSLVIPAGSPNSSPPCFSCRLGRYRLYVVRSWSDDWSSWYGKDSDLYCVLSNSLQEGMTPLLVACEGGRSETILFLFEKGANLFSKDEVEHLSLSHWFHHTTILWSCLPQCGRSALYTIASEHGKRSPCYLLMQKLLVSSSFSPYLTFMLLSETIIMALLLPRSLS